MNRASETKASQSFFLRLELGIPEFALPLPFFFELHATEEMFKGDIQITQSLLWSALRDRVHPGQFALLQLVEFAVQFHRTDTATGLFVDLLLAREAPIVSESCSPGMLLAGCDLLVIQVKFGSIAPRDLHRLLSYTENTSFHTDDPKGSYAVAFLCEYGAIPRMKPVLCFNTRSVKWPSSAISVSIPLIASIKSRSVRIRQS